MPRRTRVNRLYTIFILTFFIVPFIIGCHIYYNLTRAYRLENHAIRPAKTFPDMTFIQRQVKAYQWQSRTNHYAFICFIWAMVAAWSDVLRCTAPQTWVRDESVIPYLRGYSRFVLQALFLMSGIAFRAYACGVSLFYPSYLFDISHMEESQVLITLEILIMCVFIDYLSLSRSLIFWGLKPLLWSLVVIANEERANVGMLILRMDWKMNMVCLMSHYFSLIKHKGTALVFSFINNIRRPARRTRTIRANVGIRQSRC